MNDQIRSIKKRMRAVPGLVIDNFGLSSHLGKRLSPGCRACKENKWTTVFIGKACNCSCYFCPQPHKKPALGSREDNDGIIGTSFSREFSEHLLVKLKNAAHNGSMRAVGYSGGDPLLYAERIIYFAGELNGSAPSLYQYIETNARSLNRKMAGELRGAGIKEIRFNLAATDYSPLIIKKMRYTRKIMPFLTVILPALRQTPKMVERHIGEFIDIGVDQITLCEMVVNSNNDRYFKGEQFYSIGSEERYPIFSRHVIYDVMSAAAKEGWPITINECSALNHQKPGPLF